MNTEELVFLLSVTVVMPIAALWIILGYQKTRLKIKQMRTDDSLTVSELTAMIEESVAEATGPLSDRVAELERQLRLVGPASEASRLSDELGPDSEREAEPERVKTLGRTR